MGAVAVGGMSGAVKVPVAAVGVVAELPLPPAFVCVLLLLLEEEVGDVAFVFAFVVVAELPLPLALVGVREEVDVSIGGGGLTEEVGLEKMRRGGRISM